MYIVYMHTGVLWIFLPFSSFQSVCLICQTLLSSFAIIAIIACLLGGRILIVYSQSGSLTARSPTVSVLTLDTPELAPHISHRSTSNVSLELLG